MDIRIAVLQRGWMEVGVYSNHGMMGHLERSATVRRWGTERGLGQLAEDGPTDQTQLDPVRGTQRFHELAVVKYIDCNADVWGPVLEGLHGQA